MTRNLCCKCPHYYNEQSYCGEYDWGCRVFGVEFEHCPSFWDNDGDADESEIGCNVHPKRIEFLLMRENKRIDAYIKRDFKDNKLVKHYSVLPKEAPAVAPTEAPKNATKMLEIAPKCDENGQMSLF